MAKKKNKSKLNKTLLENKLILFIILLVSILTFLILFINNSNINSVSSNSNDSPAATPEPDVSIKFDPFKAKPGDKVGNMSIVSITEFNGNGQPTEKSIEASFTGEVTLTGEVSYTTCKTDELCIGPKESMCVHNLNENSLIKLPKFANSNRSTWFCFDDIEKAKNLIGTPSTPTTKTFTIDNYKLVNYPSEVWNTASLISVK